MGAALDRQRASAPDCAALSDAASLDAALAQGNRCLKNLSAEARVRWALDRLPGTPMLSSSFGAQAAVMLHLVTRAQPAIPVVLIDTGYLFPETYRFVDTLTARLQLNLKVYRPELSAAWQEARHGRRWE
ncbi:MAG: phosphoadenosine phosphosulfate reductase family protein, partial [Pseudomonadota bacterium]